MKILLTNDDGIESGGLHALADALRKKHDVLIIAPHCNRSAVSHGITMTEPLRLKKIDERTYSYAGLPCDCVIAGLSSVFSETPDAVFSGINQGKNAGTDIIYSGTVAAARQAALSGLPGVAVSMVCGESCQWRDLADFTANNAENLVSLAADDIFINVNAPARSPYRGVCFTSPSRIRFNDDLSSYTAADGGTYLFFAGGEFFADESDGTDSRALKDGYISISRIYAQPAYARAENLNDLRFLL